MSEAYHHLATEPRGHPESECLERGCIIRPRSDAISYLDRITAKDAQIAALEERNQYLEIHMKQAHGERAELHEKIAAKDAQITMLEHQVADLEDNARRQVSRADHNSRQCATLEAEVERLTKIRKLQAAALDVWKKAHPHDQSLGACAAALAPFVALARAANMVTQGHRPECFGSGTGDEALAQALAHPAVQRAVTVTP